MTEKLEPAEALRQLRTAYSAWAREEGEAIYVLEAVGSFLKSASANALLNAARAEARPAPVVGREGEPSEDFIKLVAEAMGVRTGYSISLTRLVDGVETYTLSMDGYEPQDFDDRDEAAEVLHQRLNRDRAKRVLALLPLQEEARPRFSEGAIELAPTDDGKGEHP